MLIFLLVFAAIIANLSAMFHPSMLKAQQEVRYAEQKAVAETIVQSPGFPISWGTAPGDPQVFGIAASNGHELDISKLSRLQTTSATWQVDYQTAEDSLGIENGGFSVGVRPFFDVSTSLNLAGSTLTVSGDVLDISANPTAGARLWIYVMDSTLTVTQLTSTTDASGQYSVSTGVTLANAPFVAVVISSVYGMYQDFAIARIDTGGATAGSLTMDSVAISADGASTTNITIYTDQAGAGTASLVSFYAVPTGQTLPDTSRTMSLSAGSFSATTIVPQNGTVVFVTARGTDFAFTATPMPSTAEFNGLFGPFDDTNADLLNYQITSFVSSARSVPLDVRIWTW